MKSLGERYPEAQARMRQLLTNGRSIGPAGAFYCLMAEDLLRRADAAAVAQDLPEMLRCYREMEDFRE